VIPFLISIDKEIKTQQLGKKKSLRLAFGIDVAFSSGRLFTKRRTINAVRSSEEASEGDPEQKKREVVKMCMPLQRSLHSIISSTI